MPSRSWPASGHIARMCASVGRGFCQTFVFAHEQVHCAMHAFGAFVQAAMATDTCMGLH